MVRSRATFTPSPATGCTPAPTHMMMMMTRMMIMTRMMMMMIVIGDDDGDGDDNKRMMMMKMIGMMIQLLYLYTIIWYRHESILADRNC